MGLSKNEDLATMEKWVKPCMTDDGKVAVTCLLKITAHYMPLLQIEMSITFDLDSFGL